MASVLGTASTAQQVPAERLCDQSVLSMLEMISSIGKTSDALDTEMNLLPDDEKAKFGDVGSAGDDLRAAAEAYRAAFLRACFG